MTSLQDKIYPYEEYEEEPKPVWFGRTIFIVAFIGVVLLLWKMYGVETGSSYSYKADGKSYTLLYKPADEETELLILRFKVHSLNTCIGSVVKADSPDAPGEEVYPLMIDNLILMRTGFTDITNEDFVELIEKSKHKFADLRTLHWEEIKYALSGRNLARPLLVDGEFDEDRFRIHNVILEYWGRYNVTGFTKRDI